MIINWSLVNLSQIKNPKDTSWNNKKINEDIESFSLIHVLVL